eukprot:2271628-Amphidinium_carterae.3
MKVVPEAWNSMRSDAEGSLKFLRAHDKLWPLVLPESDVQVVLTSKHGTKWSALADEVSRICRASVLGSRLFDFALVEVCESVVSSRIASVINTLGSGAVLDEASVRKARNDAKDSLRSVTGVGSMPDRREIEVSYRGWQLKLPVRSLEDEVQVRVMCAVRGWLAAKKHVRQLPGEIELCANDAGLAFTKIENDLTGPIEASRKELQTLMAALTVQNGDGLKVLIL